MSGFTAIDLSQLSPPDIVEALDFEALLAQMVADLQARDPEFTAILESDPAVKVLEVAAFRELLIRQRVNEAARAVMLATSAGADLDQVAARFNVARLVVDPGDPTAVPPIAPTLEDDERLRARAQLALEGLTNAGTVGSYTFHALSAGAAVKDVDVACVTPGQVDVTVLSTVGDGTPDAALLTTVSDALNADGVRPLCDTINVAAPVILPFTITATLTFYSGPDTEVVRQTAEDAVTAFTEEHHRLGHDITRSGLLAALHQPGVHNVTLTSPAADIVIPPNQAAFCTAKTITAGGIDE